MNSQLTNILTIVIGVAGVLIPLVAPLYYLVMDMREDKGAADERRSNLSDSQDDLAQEIDELADEVHGLRDDVNRNSVRTETNQRHLHELLIRSGDVDSAELGPVAHTAEECPFPDQCPWHGD